MKTPETYIKGRIMRITKISLLLIAFYFNANSQEITWESKAPLPLGHHSGSAVTGNGKIYHVGGQKKNGASWIMSNQMFEFDPAKNEWSEKSNLPTVRCNLATASVDGKIYVIGGDSFLNTNEVYDPATDSWTNLTAMPTARQHIKGAVVAGKIYIIGGLETWYKVSNKNEVYDPLTNVWEQKSPIPTPKHNYAATVFDDKIYIFGGATQSGNNVWIDNSSVEIYDPVTNSWDSVSTMPTARFNPGIAVVEDKILILGGYAGDNVSNRVDIFDPVTKSWSATSALPQINVAMGSTISNNKIFIVGGSEGGPAWTHYNTVYEGTFTGTTHIKLSEEQPSTFNLSQNFPNPFNPTTKIEFAIPSDNIVEIKVFNILGMEVATLLSEHRHAGTHEVKFNASKFSSGIYFYKIVSGNYSEIKKMTLLR